MIKIIELPKDDNPNIEYVMGIDPYGFDDKTSSICVMKRAKGGGTPMGIQYVNSFRNEKDYEKEIKRLTQYYNIPEENILKETK